MDWGQQVKNSNEQALNGFYQTTRSRFERVERKSLIIDVDKDLTGTNDFSVSLHEPLKIDKLSDIYLDTFTTKNCTENTDADKMAFLLGINEFNINSNSGGNAKAFNKIMIPNSSSTAGAHIATHKDKKFNYVCSINPTTLSQINGTISDLDGGFIFDANSRFIAEFIIIARD